MAARQWTLEQRQQQAEKIRQWHPWTQSTGAKTQEGKAISSQNAKKDGMCKLIKHMRELLKSQKTCIKNFSSCNN